MLKSALFNEIIKKYSDVYDWTLKDIKNNYFIENFVLDLASKDKNLFLSDENAISYYLGKKYRGSTGIRFYTNDFAESIKTIRKNFSINEYNIEPYLLEHRSNSSKKLFDVIIYEKQMELTRFNLILKNDNAMTYDEALIKPFFSDEATNLKLIKKELLWIKNFKTFLEANEDLINGKLFRNFEQLYDFYWLNSLDLDEKFINEKLKKIFDKSHVHLLKNPLILEEELLEKYYVIWKNVHKKINFYENENPSFNEVVEADVKILKKFMNKTEV